MSYRIVIPKLVENQIEELPDFIQERILKRTTEMTKNPRPFGSIKLKGTKNEYRTRIGNYRLRYQILDKELLVVLVSCKHRKDVYR